MFLTSFAHTRTIGSWAAVQRRRPNSARSPNPETRSWRDGQRVPSSVIEKQMEILPCRFHRKQRRTLFSPFVFDTIIRSGEFMPPCGALFPPKSICSPRRSNLVSWVTCVPIPAAAGFPFRHMKNGRHNSRHWPKQRRRHQIRRFRLDQIPSAPRS